MAKKKRVFMLAIMLALMAALMIFTTGCMGKNEDFVETESGWTIEEDGSYTYACVVKNISEDKMISSAGVVTNGLDADGETMKKVPEWEGSGFMIGSIMPGEKVAVVMDSYSSSDPMSQEWESTPAAFSFNVNLRKLVDAQSDEAESIPDIRIVSAEQTYSDSDLSEYEFVLENNEKEDLNVDLTGAGGYMFNIVAVCRDGDGNITGGSNGDILTEDGFISLPAGEKVEYTVYFNSLPEGEPEFILNPF